jgi:hypothetical protein
MDKRIEILDSVVGFEVRVVSEDGRTLRRFTYLTVEGARKGASAWTAAYANCEVRDLTGREEHRERPRSELSTIGAFCGEWLVPERGREVSYQSGADMPKFARVGMCQNSEVKSTYITNLT